MNGFGKTWHDNSFIAKSLNKKFLTKKKSLKKVHLVSVSRSTKDNVFVSKYNSEEFSFHDKPDLISLIYVRNGNKDTDRQKHKQQ